MTREEIQIDLSSSKSLHRRRAAKAIREDKLKELSENLFDAYVREAKDVRTWETQVEIILTFKKQKPVLERSSDLRNCLSLRLIHLYSQESTMIY